ncbi:SH3 domain-containing protein [Cellulophaga sp. BC115SP]|uniref:SH3 domain-containing protein n=1 Tax=Cellulophaga sp. BC115SP TaxID=2683263 RepID=UPI0014125F52|nr:SH3 domain-containing protein [Cellulophaga sp. BC115SP]NBB26974.1 hypothetical protein [Cellulophaga sp. BC115SP]
MVKNNKNSIINIVYGSLLLLFFMGLIVFGPEKLSEYKHNLIAVISSLLVGIFGYFLTGEVGLKINSKFLENKVGKIAIQASGGVALFVLTMVWWRSPLTPIEKVQDKIIEEQQKGVKKIESAIDSTSNKLSKAISDDGDKTRETVVDAALAQLEGMFLLVVRNDRDVDGTIIKINGEEKIPIVSYDNGFTRMKLMWGDRFHYFIFYKNRVINPADMGQIILELSNGVELPLELTYHENEIRIPGHNSKELTAYFLNPNRIKDIEIKITIYSADRERGRKVFKDALMKTSLSSRARQVYKEIKTDGVRLRNDSTDNAKTVRTLREGTYLKVIQEVNGISLIRLPEGREGWVKSSYIGNID